MFIKRLIFDIYGYTILWERRPQMEIESEKKDKGYKGNAK